jgi:hypothetical protein
VTPKIAICIPFQQGVSLRWAINFRNLYIPFPTTQLITSQYRIDLAREELVERALEDDPTHILFLDCDILPPFYAVERALLFHRYPLVYGYYWSKRGCPCAWNWDGGGYVPVRLQKGYWDFVDVAGLGFALIDARIFRMVEEKEGRPWFQYEAHKGEDTYFAEKVRKATSLRLLVDASIECKHEELMHLQTDGRAEYQRVIRRTTGEKPERREATGF